MSNTDHSGYELDWNSPIEADSSYAIQPAGDYDFEVTAFERGRHNGSDKLPPCNKAILHLRIFGPEGNTTIKHNLFMHSKVEGLLCEFFTSIGARKKGEKINMDFNGVVGATGRAKVAVRSWKKDDGDTGESNEIKKFYPKVLTPAAKSYESGDF